MNFRPALRPGAPLLRRDATHLQVGTSPGIVIRDRPGLLPLLRLLDGVRDVERLQQLARTDAPELDQPVAAVLTELRSAGVVVDASEDPAARRRHGLTTVGLDAGPGASELLTTTRTILTASGVAPQAGGEADLLVIASLGEASRAVFERAVIAAVDHLPVVIDEDRVRIGPLVRPGRTPCVACHDLHRTDWDPAWPALVHQLGKRPPLIRPVSLAPLTAHAAAVELAAEVIAYVDGVAPRSTGRCLVVGPGHDARTSWPVAFHHRCACDLLNAA